MGPNSVSFWDYFLDPVFLVTAGLVLAFFLPMLLSIWLTWEASDDETYHPGADGA
jgi:hypothetical protein